MPKFAVTVDVKEAGGTQTFLIEAASPEEAARKWNAGDHDSIILSSDVEVIGLDSEVEADQVEPYNKEDWPDAED